VSLAPEKLEELRRRVREDPGSHHFLGLAEELLRRGQREEALAVLDTGLAARPGQVSATVARARCLIELGRPLEAREGLESVLERDPTHLVAAKLAVELWLGVGDRERARASMDRYAPLGAADPELGRLEKRVRELQSTAPADDDELVTVTLGNLYLLQGHRAEAERIFRRVLASDPDNQAAHQGLARALGSSGSGGGRQDI
jgi:predicted Zn-dependent protease